MIGSVRKKKLLSQIIPVCDLVSLAMKINDQELIANNNINNQFDHVINSHGSPSASISLIWRFSLSLGIDCWHRFLAIDVVVNNRWQHYIVSFFIDLCWDIEGRPTLNKTQNGELAQWHSSQHKWPNITDLTVASSKKL